LRARPSRWTTGWRDETEGKPKSPRHEAVRKVLITHNDGARTKHPELARRRKERLACMYMDSGRDSMALTFQQFEVGIRYVMHTVEI
jgi:hypothetical protein